MHTQCKHTFGRDTITLVLLHPYKYTRTCIHRHIHTHTHSHTMTHICTHTCMHAHMRKHTCIHPAGPPGQHPWPPSLQIQVHPCPGLYREWQHAGSACMLGPDPCACGPSPRCVTDLPVCMQLMVVWYALSLAESRPWAVVPLHV
jgi:uncharacterized membrane protein